MIGILDYGIGNIGSVKRKLDLLEIRSFVANSPLELQKADKFIFPGVGHFSEGVRNLKRSGLWDFLNESVLVKKKPILGICLGMQLMGKYSEEGGTEGLGWFDFNVEKFKIKDKKKFKVPHVGWNQVVSKKASRLLYDLQPDSEFYFTHSYHVSTSHSEDILLETNHEYSFVSGVEREMIFGLQFHPEKSHHYGNMFFLNFAKL